MCGIQQQVPAYKAASDTVRYFKQPTTVQCEDYTPLLDWNHESCTSTADSAYRHLDLQCSSARRYVFVFIYTVHAYIQLVQGC